MLIPDVATSGFLIKEAGLVGNSDGTHYSGFRLKGEIVERVRKIGEGLSLV